MKRITENEADYSINQSTKISEQGRICERESKEVDRLGTIQGRENSVSSINAATLFIKRIQWPLQLLYQNKFCIDRSVLFINTSYARIKYSIGGKRCECIKQSSSNLSLVSFLV